MTAEAMWNTYCSACGVDSATPHSAWCFGGAPDELAELVLKGIKTATCSWYDLYALDDEEPVPQVGDISIILNEQEEAVCIIRDTRVYQTRFCEVTAEHAYKEGEGDRSLAYWRKVHLDFFAEESRAYGLPFDENIPVLCEEFQVVYRP